MFRRIDLPQGQAPRMVTIQVDGRPLTAQEGTPLAAALMTAGVVPLRKTAVSGAPRAPLCMMGVCFECVVDVDGSHGTQSCMVEVRDGMQVFLSTGARSAQGAAT
ncbi:MAG: (2Fe-2S)-binding protein [Ramlibacter sp.]